MGLMSKTMFEGFADRIAKQYSYIKVCFQSLASTAEGTSYYERITASNDPDVELSLLGACNTADKWFRNETKALTNSSVRSMGSYTSLIRQFDEALRSDGTLLDKSWDGYCNYVGTRVSDYTNQVFYCTYNMYMYAKNVWCEDEKILGTAIMTDSTTLTFTSGDTLYEGNFNNTQRADGTHYGASKLKIKITGLNTISSLVVNVTGRNEAGVIQTVQVTISGVPETEILVGTNEKFLDVTNITRVSGGNTNDSFIVNNVKDRIIEL